MIGAPHTMKPGKDKPRPGVSKEDEDMILAFAKERRERLRALTAERKRVVKAYSAKTIAEKMDCTVNQVNWVLQKARRKK